MRVKYLTYGVRGGGQEVVEYLVTEGGADVIAAMQDGRMVHAEPET